MIPALWTGISGLAGQQVAIDNESHNISNVNTVGYKASRISFADQIYQDKIGKGTKILDAEKLFTQGNTKRTGVSYDMALKGSGFFSVAKTSASGSSEIFYTRAGNLRMGDNGTLQDSAGNEVRGWAMSPLDTEADVISTNPNANVFTADYNKLVTSKVIKHSNYIETVTAKTTDFEKTARGDTKNVFTGDGRKSQASKVSDVEELVKNYTEWLTKLQVTPEIKSSSSTAQVTQIKFDGSTLKKEKDELTVYIDGQAITQEYVQTPSNGIDYNGDGITTGDAAIAADDLAASRMATYKAMADQISKIAGFEAYTVTDGSTSGVAGLFESSDTFSRTTAAPERTSNGSNITRANAPSATYDPGTLFPAPQLAGAVPYTVTRTDPSTGSIISRTFNTNAIANVTVPVTYNVTYEESVETFSVKENSLLGMIEIRAMIPGKEFKITEVSERSGTTVSQGQINTTESATRSITGSGVGALESAKAALSRAVTGIQRDVFTPDQMQLGNAAALGGDDYQLELLVYDKDTKQNVTIGPIQLQGVESIDDVIAALKVGGSPADTNRASQFNQYFTAQNVNGNLVVATNDANYDIEFTSTMLAVNKGIKPTYDSGNNIIFQDAEFNLDPDGSKSYEFDISYMDTSAPPVRVPIAPFTINNSADMDALIVSLNAAAAPLVASKDAATGNLKLDLPAAAGSGIQIQVKEMNKNQLVEKHADHSGRKGAGAEFIEIINKIDQTASQGSLQLKLDALGISDSAFGEFRVDKAGVIYMKQDGADFAIGQIAVALFNNERGLEATGDNLYAKTTSSGEPIYNINNDRTADIEGESLELSSADLSESLVNLMVFQRAFEANAKTITTADSLLNTLINLKR